LQVSAIVAWPSRRLTCSTLAPLWSGREAKEWRSEDVRPLDDRELARAWWRRTRTNVTRKLATACLHPERAAHSKGRCHSCATRAWYAEHPEALARDLEKVEENRRARVREKYDLAPDAPSDDVRTAAYRTAGLRAWANPAAAERRRRKLADTWRRKKVEAVMRARAADPNRQREREVARDLDAKWWEWHEVESALPSQRGRPAEL
jgi:hypothetical protein